MKAQLLGIYIILPEFRLADKRTVAPGRITQSDVAANPENRTAQDISLAGTRALVAISHNSRPRPLGSSSLWEGGSRNFVYRRLSISEKRQGCS
jgi:hypothetical protein